MLSSAFAYRVVLLVAPAMVCACTIIPKSGPSTIAIEAGQAVCAPRNIATTSAAIDSPSQTLDFPYQLVRVTPRIIGGLVHAGNVTFSDAFTDRRPPADIRFGTGDVVSVSIYASGGGLQPKNDGPSGNSINLTDQWVDGKGNITAPYAGSIHVAGRTPTEVREEIKRRLADRFLEPDVVVTLKEQHATQVAVLGEVNKPNRFPINPAGERILDIIARAEGLKSQGFESFVTLMRGGKTATVYFDKIIGDQRNNIYVWPGDSILVSRKYRTFSAYGAVGSSVMGTNVFTGAGASGGLVIRFDSDAMSLVEALGKAYGLQDSLANPAAVFVFRFERREILEGMGIDVSCWHSPTVPVIYNTDFGIGSGLFLAQGFPMQDKDVLYVDNAAAVDITKFLIFLQTMFGTVQSATSPIDSTINTVRDYKYLRNNPF
jgi:polysaccharide export outer membrane protein